MQEIKVPINILMEVINDLPDVRLHREPYIQVPLYYPNLGYTSLKHLPSGNAVQNCLLFEKQNTRGTVNWSLVTYVNMIY